MRALTWVVVVGCSKDTGEPPQVAPTPVVVDAPAPRKLPPPTDDQLRCTTDLDCGVTHPGCSKCCDEIAISLAARDA